ncbi:CopD family protein [Polymorphobacter sp.]|uniref:CopD family protein n=1 Tax=Polymorphobacter sp. TaxID=1909290 RepID=UPI003F6EA1CC
MTILVALKTVHIAALIIWCAGLLALPLLLMADHEGQSQSAYTRLRLTLQNAYVGVVTPAAIVAVAVGTALIFVAEVYVPWMFAKLVAVGFLVGLHGLTGHAIIAIGERPGEARLLLAIPRLVAALLLMIIILVLVLAKPVIPLDLVPDWLMTPRDIQLPLDEVPI